MPATDRVANRERQGEQVLKKSVVIVSIVALGLIWTVKGAYAADAPSDPKSAPARSEVDPDYKIGPGDELEIFVWRNPELSAKVPVRPDGKISTPLVENVVAVGKTPGQLGRDIEQVLSKFIRGPQVNVIVNTATGALSQVRVVGQVKNLQAVPYHKGLTVLDVVLAAGGLGEFAAGNRAKIVRTAPGGKTKEIRVRLNDILHKGRMDDNVLMQPGDVLIVPESRF